jgi:hypothetical protein
MYLLPLQAKTLSRVYGAIRSLEVIDPTELDANFLLQLTTFKYNGKAMLF